MSSKPVVYLLCGLPGSGKTTFAKQLENENAIRLTLDEELFKMFGREFPSEQYNELEAKTKEVLLRRAELLLTEGKPVILDWGFWKKKERDEITSFIQKNGGEAKLLYFKADPEVCFKRVQNRDLSVNHEINEEMFKNFSNQFEEPVDEGEKVIS